MDQWFLDDDGAPIEPISSELAEQVLENARLLAERRVSRKLNALPVQERAERIRDHVRFVGQKIARAVDRLAPDLIEVEEHAVRCAETGRSISVSCEGGRILLERSWLTGTRRRATVEELQVDDDLLYVRLNSNEGGWASIWELVGEILEE